MNYYIGFTTELTELGLYPDGMVKWCNDNQKIIKDNGDGTYTITEPVVEEPDYDTEYLSKKNEYKNFHDLVVANMLYDYSQSEISSFYKQESEATAYFLYKEANGLPTQEYIEKHFPFLNSAAIARGITLDEIATKVIIASAKSVNIQGVLMGAKQRCEDLLKATTTVADIQAINVVSVFASELNSLGLTVNENGIIKPL